MLRLTNLWYAPLLGIPIDPPGEPGLRYTVTWVVSGPLDETAIVQHIYLDADASPLVHTPTQQSLDGWGGDVIGWFQAPDELAQLVEEIIATAVEGTSETERATLVPPVAFAAVAALVLWRRLRARSGGADLDELGQRGHRVLGRDGPDH